MRPRRPDYSPGQYYHIYNRGAHGVSIFRQPDNYLYVLSKVKHYAAELSLSVIAYCLMPNHYHILVRQGCDQAAGLLPQRIFNSYSKAYNLCYQHSGTLFQGPYQVIHVVQESHLLHLCRYIHANPVKDGLVSGLEDWSYSNYPEWIGTRPGVLVDRDFVQAHFPDPASYASFVGDYLKHRTLPEEVRAYLERFERM